VTFTSPSSPSPGPCQIAVPATENRCADPLGASALHEVRARNSVQQRHLVALPGAKVPGSLQYEMMTNPAPPWEQSASAWLWDAAGWRSAGCVRQR